MPWQSSFTQGNYTLTKILHFKKPLLVVEFESIMFCKDISFLSGICISKTLPLLAASTLGDQAERPLKLRSQATFLRVCTSQWEGVLLPHSQPCIFAWRAVRNLGWAAGLGRWQWKNFFGRNSLHGSRFLICIMFSVWKRFERPIKVWLTMVSHFLTRQQY